MKKKIFAFDMGKASIGYCVREGHDLKEANSVLIEKEHASYDDIRGRRRINKTLNAHIAREKFFDDLWLDCGLELLDKDDMHIKKEFPSTGEDVIYTSCLLRAALVQNIKLEQWQIYKALRNAIQRRGYDVNILWKSSQNDDDRENEERTKNYTQSNGVELISDEKYRYPCYYDALRLGLWSEKYPDKFRRSIPLDNSNKVRTTEYVAPRSLVERELIVLWLNAQSQIPELNKYDAEYFLYGEYRSAYASYLQKGFRQYMGTENDWQGVLGQKIPRFNNRIISKCKLLPERNVSRADCFENVSFLMLMKLKNLRIKDGTGESIRFSPEDINKIYNEWVKKMQSNDNKLDTTITKKEIEKTLGISIIDKFEPLKIKLSGRSSFCRRACQIMNKVILSGELYPLDVDITEFVDKPDSKNGITEEEIKEMLSKVGDWNNLFIPDNRDMISKEIYDIRMNTDRIIGGITNPIVRNRLQIFRDLLLNLKNKYQAPDEVIFEFVRDSADNSLFGRIKAQSAEIEMKKNQKKNEQIKKELEEIGALTGINFEKMRLLKMQGGRCIYSGREISPSNFDECEIDHIYPRANGGNDALYNKVLCYRSENQYKLDRTPYEWFHNDTEKWTVYVNRLNTIKKELGRKKYELLTGKPEDGKKLLECYNALAETAYIARLAQQIAAVVFDWTLQTEGEKRHIYVNNGSSTAAIRKRYGLNSLLGNDIEKNRANDKHHALDAICISYSRDFKYDKNLKKDVIDGFNPLAVKELIDSIIPYPYTNKKPLKANTTPLETIYGYRNCDGKSILTNRISIEKIKKSDKTVKTIIDKVIRQDLIDRLSLSDAQWTELLKNYVHPKKGTKVKKVLVKVSEGVLETDTNGRKRLGEYVDFGNKGTKHQFKHSKSHKGQILYYNENGKIKVMPVYANIKTSDIKDKLESMGCKLYKKGMMFYSGCLLEIPNEFKAGMNTYPAGIYKLRTIMTGGQAKLESNTGIEILSSAAYLAEANFRKLKS